MNDNGSTRRKGVASVPLQAEADGSVVADTALGIESARTRTRVTALVVDTSPIPRTVRVENTLRATTCPRVSKVPRSANAGTCAMPVTTQSVGPTRRRSAWIPRSLKSHFRHTIHYCKQQAVRTETTIVAALYPVQK